MGVNFRLEKNEANVVNVVEMLERNGVVVIDSFYHEPLASRLEKIFDDVMRNDDIPASKSYAAGVLKNDLACDSSAIMQKEFGREFFREVSEKFLNSKKIFVTNIFYHHDMQKTNQHINPWHFDNIQSLKFFIYLKDTTKENGAFRYDIGSHIEGNARARLHLLEGGKITNMPNVKDERFILNGVDIEAKRGSLIIFDTDGYHGGGIVSKESRKVIRLHYRKKGFYTYRPHIASKQLYHRLANKVIYKMFGGGVREASYEGAFSKGIDY